MENLRTSKRQIVSRENGKYFVSAYNQYTNSTKTNEIIFDENGKCRIESEGLFVKAEIDVAFETVKIFENKLQ
jgi:phosphoenolpyruvate synthase/pyruvate phosphate dikinase